MFSMLVSSSCCTPSSVSVVTSATLRIPKNGLSLFGCQRRLQRHGCSLKQARKARIGCSVPVKASLFGVGAPEVLVIAVVSLIVFGPKGLAEVARSLGKTLKEFQPTIKELQDVSKDFKEALEKEIGLEEPASSSIYKQPPSKPEPKPYSAEEYLKVTEEQLTLLVSEEDRKAAEAQAWGKAVPVKSAGQDATPSLTTTSQVEKSNQQPEE